MHTRLILCLAALVVALTGVRVHAADVTPRRYSMDEPSAYNWTGGYFGINGGYIDHTLAIGDEGTPDQNPAGGFGGAQAGYNYQLPAGVVLGVEFDVGMGQSSDDVHDGKSIAQSSSVDVFGTLRGRVGYAFDRVLVYGTAGAAFEQASLSEECPAGAEFGHCCKTPLGYKDTEKFFDVGLAYGGGVEIGLSEKMTIKVEYLRLDFGSDNHDLGEHSSDREVDQKSDLVRVGINYKP